MACSFGIFNETEPIRAMYERFFSAIITILNVSASFSQAQHGTSFYFLHSWISWWTLNGFMRVFFNKQRWLDVKSVVEERKRLFTDLSRNVIHYVSSHHIQSFNLFFILDIKSHKYQIKTFHSFLSFFTFSSFINIQYSAFSSRKSRFVVNMSLPYINYENILDLLWFTVLSLHNNHQAYIYLAFKSIPMKANPVSYVHMLPFMFHHNSIQFFFFK